jgi:hypothetical protein
MKNLKLATLIVLLLLGHAMTSPVTAQKNCDPGQILTPCSSAPTTNSDSNDPGQISTSPASDSVDFVSVADAALTAMLIF